MYENGHEELLDITGTLNAADIPDAGHVVQLVTGSKVTEIGNYCFNSSSSLKTVVLSDSVTTLGQHAFHYCSKLENVSFGNKLSVIRGYAFQNATSLKTVVLPASLTTMADTAFTGCTRIRKVTIPQAVCSSKLSLKFPNSY